MIFVTVGTTHFDALVEAVDKYYLSTRTGEVLLFQIGAGSYQPTSGEFFRFKPSIDAELDSASLVITHGGMTVLGLLAKRKRFVAVANSSLADDHQTSMLRRISSNSSLIWTNQVSGLPACIERAMSSDPASWTGPSLAKDLNDYLHQTRRFPSGSGPRR